MVWSLIFAVLIVVVVILRFLRRGGERCPECSAARDPESPLCRECGWIYEVPGEEDSDYGDPEDY